MGIVDCWLSTMLILIISLGGRKNRKTCFFYHTKSALSKTMTASLLEFKTNRGQNGGGGATAESKPNTNMKTITVTIYAICSETREYRVSF